MRLIIRDDAEATSAYVARYIVDRIKAFQPTPQNPFVLGLPTGSSPLGVYRMLVEMYKSGQSYHTFMWTNLFAHVNIHPSNVHILNGNAPNLEAECVSYEEAIRSAGGIDLFLAGIGDDGHIAFNEPGSSLASRTRVKTLAYDTILANSRFFGNDVSQVPRMALTVGVQTVLESREIVAIILGQRKSLALQRCVEQGVNHMWTLSSLQLHPHPMICVDEDATLELQVKTVKYFKSIEKVAVEQGFEQILPSKVRTGNSTATGSSDGNQAANAQEVHVPFIEAPIATSPTILAPQPTTSRLLRPTTPANEYPVRSVSPDVDLVPDRMASRIPEKPQLTQRLTPNPEKQLLNGNVNHHQPTPIVI
ncbi:glucosamine-6-phosphate deaminase [Geosmithia morbida]|uniref:Glucosamine-6-phosphate isomerase n=1 Tax=Geosmithia morbida TaxID=1094350 RepID=A0A9P5D424_9HYPO|nr:glucosamine-6-phosphate deaminase [Geosmithia morbida]KAF4125597.1 glucosamine-6-phosphate deaminase [Geosmithia morbida]